MRHRWNEKKTKCVRCGLVSKFVKRKKLRMTGDPGSKTTFDRVFIVKGKQKFTRPACKGNI